MTELVRGYRGKLGDSLDVSQPVTVRMQTAGGAVYDTCCFGVDAGDKLSDDRYMVFYNQTASPNGEITYSGSGNVSEYTVKLGTLPQNIVKLVFTVSIDGEGTMGQIQSHTISICQNGAEMMRLTLGGQDFRSEKAIIGIEVYLKTVWRIAVVASGFNGGLSDLLANYGGELADEPAPAQQAAPAPQPQPVPTPPPVQPQPQFGQQAAPPPMQAQYGQQTPPPPMQAHYGQQTPPPPMQPQFGQQAPPPPMQPQFGQQTPPPPMQPQYGQQAAPPPMQAQFGQQTAPPPMQAQFGQQTPPPPMQPRFGGHTPQQAYGDRPFSEPVPLRAPSGIPAFRPEPFEVMPLPQIPPVPKQINDYQTVPLSQAMMRINVNLKPESYDTRPLPSLPQTGRGAQFDYDTRPV